MSETDTKTRIASDMPNWAISGRCYLAGTLPYVLHLTSGLLAHLGIISDSSQYFHSIPSIVLVQLLLLLLLVTAVGRSKLGIAWRALLLGCVLNLGLTLGTYSTGYQTFGIYLIFLSLFHWSEYVTQAVHNPNTTGVDNYMLYHSDAYVVAFFVALGEFAVESYLWPMMKEANFVTNVGISLVVFGECLRKASMWTAKSNFNHYVQFNRQEEHQLVTHGVYSLFRHPSYVGWFWWSLGTQLILLNPVCTVAYAIASWKFFSERIYTEEMTLIKFFGAQYIEYQGRVGTGLPFIRGYTVSNPLPGSASSERESDD